MTTIGERLKELRTAKGLTQSELGRRAEVGKSQISRYEAGVVHPSVATMYRLAYAFGVEVSELIAGTK